MTRSTPSRRSEQLTSPERRFLSSFLAENRNNELSHRDALIAAQIEHERVREAAIRVYELHELQQEHRRIVEQERKEEERLKAEALVVAEERRLRELRAKTIPRPPPEPIPEPRKEPPPEKPAPPSKANGSTPPQESKKAEPSTTPLSEIKKPASQPNGIFSNQTKPTPANPFAPTTTPAETKPAPAAANPFASFKPQTVPPSSSARPNASTAPIPVAPKPAQPQPPVVSTPSADRYGRIHKELKKLRQDLMAASKVPGSPLKGKMGTFRREIRVSIGQLTAVRGANAQPIAKITATLMEALEGKVPSPPIDVSLFVVDKRDPAEGAPNNGAMLPSLFVYLMNICSKAIISQFINEGGANTKAADPIGVFAAHIFSHKDFQWRGQSLIDILMAKYRIVCPVLFGFRGNDKTERGRTAIGWKKDGASWVTEQSHNDRMTGLGAGFASLSLRDFSKTSKTNPYPPSNYWKALAGIINSPAGETSNTQYIVLRSMIDGHEQRFLNFYGNAALAALRLALIEFPKKAPQNAMAAESLRALADMLRGEQGLILA
ncbi:Fc.00g050700.m01.CDS01 [Cosmosporella sp. VM-42]